MKYPLVKQSGLKDCGPCVLASLIIYYNGYLSVDALEDMMHTTYLGTTAYDLIEAARKIGFEGYGIKTDKLEFDVPVIVHTTNNNYNHYMLLYKVVDDKVLIGDPSTKVKYMKIDDFKKIWTNIVIVLKPYKKLPSIKPIPFSHYILNIIKKYIKHFILLILVSLIFSLISLFYSFLIKQYVDTGINKYLYIFIIIFIIKYFISLYKNKLNIDMDSKINLDLAMDINKSIISLPYIYYKNHQIGEVVSRFNDLSSITRFINGIILTTTLFPIFILYLIIMYILSKTLLTYTLIIIFIYLLFNIITSFILKNKYRRLKEYDAFYNSSFIESLTNFESIKGINIEKYIIEKNNKEYINLNKTLCKYQHFLVFKEHILDIIYNAGMLIILIIGFNKMTVGSVLAFYILYQYLSEPLGIITYLITYYIEAVNSSRRIQELSYNVTSQCVGNGSIECKNITYYHGLNKIISNINLKINCGEKIVITGPSGSGKSTLVKLIKGYYKCGGVFINNNLVKTKVDNVCYLSQNETLFRGTIKENLMSIDDQKIKDILNLCLIEQNPNTYIEEGAFNISGGEKARIVLARALLRPFDILIIDESLGELDSNRERIILKNILKQYTDKTIIFITHRYDNADLFNRYIMMDKGLIISDTA